MGNLRSTLKKVIKHFMTNKRVMVQCRTLINRDAVKRTSIDGVEHIIVSSATLPDDIVMNGGLYPADEIAKGFETLELTLAPVEHPTDSDGNFISASDPRAIHGFHAGAFNMNVHREDGRVHIDKYINVAEALKTDRGKRLLDRIDELETNDKARPIHTSVGVFIDVEETDGVQTNEAGDEFTWIARNMVFDHDAILLDSLGAAQPSQGVGVAVNGDGKKFSVERFNLNVDQSFDELRNVVMEALEKSGFRVQWIEELFTEKVVFSTGEDLFEVQFVVDDNDLVTIVGIPLPVERSVTFSPKVNSKEGDKMKDLILNALKEAKIETEGLSDELLFKAYTELQANQSEDEGEPSDETPDLAEIVANAVSPLVKKIDALESKLNAQDVAEYEKLVGVIVNSGKFPGLDEEAAKLLPVDKLREMSANCGAAHGIPLTINSFGSSDEDQLKTDMPE